MHAVRTAPDPTFPIHMTRSLLPLVVLLLTVACGASSSSPPGAPGEEPCGPRDCGPAPPGHGAIGGSVGRCERHVLCDGREASEAAPGPSSGGTGGARAGETCGGAAIAPAQPVACAAGLVCRNEAHDPGFPGTCVKP